MIKIMLLAVLAAGCVVSTGWGDGRVIEVRPDRSFSAAEQVAISQGTHVWDVWGVRYRVSEELPGRPYATICLERSSLAIGEVQGTSWPYLDRITIYADYVESLNFEADHMGALRAVVAHELGHYLGMEHVRLDGSIMYESTASTSRLTSGAGSDREEWLSLYPSAIPQDPRD